jgi:hypothetical protein
MNGNRVLAAALAAGLCLVVPGIPTATAAPAKRACVNGALVKIDGRPTYTYCGPAKATIWLEGREISYAKGRCRYNKAAKHWDLFLGFGQTGQTVPTRKYLHLDYQGGPPVAGTTYAGGMGFKAPPESLGAALGVSFETTRSGTFEGTTNTGVPIHGVFTCG